MFGLKSRKSAKFTSWEMALALVEAPFTSRSAFHNPAGKLSPLPKQYSGVLARAALFG